MLAIAEDDNDTIAHYDTLFNASLEVFGEKISWMVSPFPAVYKMLIAVYKLNSPSVDVS